MAEPLRNIIDPGWADALEPVADRIAAMGEFLRAEVAAGRRYLPSGDNVLRAFKQPFDGVRVLIVGQDPYPTPGHPVGLSFSVAPEVRRLPPSLLNRVLTVQPGQPASHRGKGWEEVTEQAIRALAAREGEPLVAILWGRDARTLVPLLAQAGDTSVPSIESAHPSPNSAHNGFFGSRPFSRANHLLEELGGEPLDWKLP